MRTSAKLGLTALIAALLLSAAVGTASARNFSISNLNHRVTWSSLEFASSLVTVRCDVTLEGSFHQRTIAKVARTLIGYVTRVDVHEASCTNGRGRGTNVPWHITYEGFTGTLPRITSIRQLLQRFLFTIERPAGLNITCRYGTATDRITGSAELDAAFLVNTLTPIEGSNTASLLEGTSGFCPTSGRMRSPVGDGRVFLLNSNTKLRVFLI